MVIDSGDAFPEIIVAVENMIIPEEWEDIIYYLKTKEEEGTSVASRFPKAALELADKLVGDKPKPVRDDLQFLLSVIAKAEPKLKRTIAFKRLTALAQC